MPNRNTIDDALESRNRARAAEQPGVTSAVRAPNATEPRTPESRSADAEGHHESVHTTREGSRHRRHRPDVRPHDSTLTPYPPAATALLRNSKREMKPNKGHSRNHEPRARSATEAASGAALKRANTECAPSQAAGCSRSHVAAFSFSALSSIAALDITEK